MTSKRDVATMIVTATGGSKWRTHFSGQRTEPSQGRRRLRRWRHARWRQLNPEGCAV